MTTDTPLGAQSEMIRRHARQRLVSMLAGPIWIGASVIVMRFWFRYRVADVEAVRARYRALREGPWADFAGYDRWFAEPINNAKLAEQLPGLVSGS